MTWRSTSAWPYPGVVHDALGFGGCHLAVAVPNAWEEVTCLRDLLSDKRWSKERPLRVVTAYMNLAEQFFQDQVGPGRYCSPCHRMPWSPRNEGSECVSMTRRVLFACS
jgi:hypothetical protein